METVLVADDYPGLRQLVSATLALDGYQILVAEDGEQAWQLVQEHHPAVVLLDVLMPGITGLDLAQAIQGDPDLASIRIILLPSSCLEVASVRSDTDGPVATVKKPFSPIKLRRAVRRALR